MESTRSNMKSDKATTKLRGKQRMQKPNISSFFGRRRERRGQLTAEDSIVQTEQIKLTDEPVKSASFHEDKEHEGIGSARSDSSSLPDIEQFLKDLTSQQMMAQIAEQKFNFKPDPKALPYASLNAEKLFNKDDNSSLWSIDDESGRREQELELTKRTLALERAKNLRLVGEIARWASLANRIRHGSDAEHTEWDSRRRALVQLMGELEGWRLHDEDEDNNDMTFEDWIR